MRIYAIIMSVISHKEDSISNKESIIDNRMYSNLEEAISELELIYDTVDLSDNDTESNIEYRIETYDLDI